MLKTKIKLVKSDPMVRVLTFQDYTGAYGSETNTEGYGAPNPSTTQVSSVIISIEKPFDVKGEASYKIEGTEARNIASGKVFTVNSQNLGVTDFEQGYKSYRDGVLDLNYYVAFQSISVTGTKGNPYVLGTNLVTIAENFDALVVGSDIYMIDKSKSTNAGTQLFLLSDLKTDVTSANVAVRANLKLKNNFRTKCGIGASAHVLNSDYRYKISEKENALMKAVRNKVASDIAFEKEDYDLTERLLKENIEIFTWMGVLRDIE